MADLPDFADGIRNIHGTPKIKVDTATVASSGIEDLINITGRGRIYSGQVNVVTTVDAKADNLGLWIDQKEYSYGEIQHIALANKLMPFISPTYITRYDTVLGNYTLCFGHDLTFEKSLYIWWENGHAAGTDIEWFIFYSIF